MRALLLTVLVAVVMAARAEAAWQPAQVVAHGVAPRVAASAIEGGLRLWGDDLRLTWTPGVLVPQRAMLPAFPLGSADAETMWAANARGDALLLPSARAPPAHWLSTRAGWVRQCPTTCPPLVRSATST